VEKLTKKDLKSPDAFISNMQRFSHWAYENRMAILGGVGVILIAAVVWAGLGTYHTQREEKAQDALFAGEKKLKTTEDSFNPNQAAQADPNEDPQAPTPKEKIVKKAAVPKTGDLNIDYKDAIAALNEVINQYGDTQAAVIAGLDLGRLYHDYKKYDDEIATLQKTVQSSKHPVTKAMALDNIGGAYESKGDCAAAITNWQKIETDTNMSPFLGEALIKTGLCYEKLNQNDKAMATYQRFDDAEKEIKKFTDSLASEYHINPNAPPESQNTKDVDKFRTALTNSAKYQALEGLLTDRQAVKAAKKYLKLIKSGATARGQAS
jgi:tetratricopeptide (TPR) repeat protein